MANVRMLWFGLSSPYIELATCTLDTLDIIIGTISNLLVRASLQEGAGGVA